MRKSLKTALLSGLTAVSVIVMTMPGIAEAKFSDEYKAKYPKNVKTTTSQLKSGKISTTTNYEVFKSKSGGLSLRVSDLSGIKVAFLTFGYAGNTWRFYDGMSWGDGKESHDIKLGMKPTRQVFRGGVSEVLAAGINPLDLQKAIVIHAHSERNGDEVVMNASHKRWKEWQEAVDAAVKLMQEK